MSKRRWSLQKGNHQALPPASSSGTKAAPVGFKWPGDNIREAVWQYLGDHPENLWKDLQLNDSPAPNNINIKRNHWFMFQQQTEVAWHQEFGPWEVDSGMYLGVTLCIVFLQTRDRSSVYFSRRGNLTLYKTEFLLLALFGWLRSWALLWCNRGGKGRDTGVGCSG